MTDIRKYTPTTSNGIHLSGLGDCRKNISINGIIAKIKKNID
jgi:hypothetical protein